MKKETYGNAIIKHLIKLNLGEKMKRLWLFVTGCFLVILVGCHTNKEINQPSQFPLLTRFIEMVHEVKGYDKNEREKFIEEALLLNESTPSNPLLKDLTNEVETIGFTEAEFLEKIG